MQIHKYDILNNVNNSENDKHFIFVCGDEIYDNTDWIKSSLQAELTSIEGTVDIPQNKNVFVLSIIDEASLSDVDKTVIQFCNDNKLNFGVFHLSDPDLIKFFKEQCGYALIFGNMSQNTFLRDMYATFKTLNIPYNHYA